MFLDIQADFFQVDSLLIQNQDSSSFWFKIKIFRAQLGSMLKNLINFANCENNHFKLVNYYLKK